MAIVSSHPKHFAHRKAIRSTWGNDFNNLHMIDSKLHGQIIFQVGLKPRTNEIDKLIKDESNQFGDILIQDFVEHYNNLTIKTVMLLKYLNHLSVIPSFVFKVCKLDVPNGFIAGAFLKHKIFLAIIFILAGHPIGI